MNTKRIKKSKLLNSLPDEWPVELRPQIQEKIAASKNKVVVLDDDPTGTQTVHNVPVLTDWSVETLQAELLTDLPAFYILTNSRSFTLEIAQSINGEIGSNLIEAARMANQSFVVVSRSDSTLRGHFPGEVEALAKALGQNFDGWIINPFFLEGGRYTIEDIHYVNEGDWLLPAAETEFARDRSFGYRSSNLCGWIEEKTGGQITLDNVISISINDLRKGGPELVASRLAASENGAVCVVNAASYRDLEVFIAGLLDAEAQGKHFLYRTAASFVQVRAGLTPRSLLTADDLELADSGNGLIIVGSYVSKTTDQVQKLFEEQEISCIEVSVEALIDEKQCPLEIKRVTKEADHALNSGNDTVIFTSRQQITKSDAISNLSVGQKISQGLIAILDRITAKPRYILAKGGITSSDIATKGLKVKRAMVCGQILPGVPVWKLGAESRWPDLAYIVFPGNVGDSQALVEVVKKMKMLKNSGQ